MSENWLRARVVESGEWVFIRGQTWSTTTDVRLATWFKDDASDTLVPRYGAVEMEEVRL